MWTHSNVCVPSLFLSFSLPLCFSFFLPCFSLSLSLFLVYFVSFCLSVCLSVSLSLLSSSPYLIRNASLSFTWFASILGTPSHPPPPITASAFTPSSFSMIPHVLPWSVKAELCATGWLVRAQPSACLRTRTPCVRARARQLTRCGFGLPLSLKSRNFPPSHIHVRSKKKKYHNFLFFGNPASLRHFLWRHDLSKKRAIFDPTFLNLIFFFTALWIREKATGRWIWGQGGWRRRRRHEEQNPQIFCCLRLGFHKSWDVYNTNHLKLIFFHRKKFTFFRSEKENSAKIFDVPCAS